MFYLYSFAATTFRYFDYIFALHFLSPKDMLPLVCQAPLPAALPPPLPDKVLHSWTSPGIHHMSPVSGGS